MDTFKNKSEFLYNIICNIKNQCIFSLIKNDTHKEVMSHRSCLKINHINSILFTIYGIRKIRKKIYTKPIQEFSLKLISHFLKIKDRVPLFLN